MYYSNCLKSRGCSTVFRPASLFYLLVSLFLCLLLMTQADAGDSPYLSGLIRTAREKKLCNNHYWHILLHYKSSAVSGLHSLIDDPKFFLSPDGKTDPQAELDATLRAFFQERSDGDAHPVCRFAARFEWLSRELDIDPAQLPVKRCDTFEDVISRLNPHTITLAFPTYHMNNPASMFGHTLLNLEAEGQESRLLAHAVNYAARTGETSGLFFAVNGLFGLYRGYYSVLPYYQKIQEYSDLSQRDIWEYPLNLKPDEIRRMILHLWELKDVYADYYFFDENCSYNILFLLEAARPSVTLTDRFSLWALPVDTIRAVKDEGLIDRADYRPSRATKIKHKITGLSPENRETVLDIIRQKTAPEKIFEAPLERAEKIRILDLSAEYLQYLYAEKKIDKASYQKILLSTLRTRSRLGKDEAVVYDVPEPSRPDEMHGTARIQAGAGIRDGHSFEEIDLRPVFSDLTDTDYVQDQGTQIELAHTAFRYYNDTARLELEKFDAVSIVSLTPRDRFFSPVSWQVNTGFRRAPMKDGTRRLFYRLATGGGFAWLNDTFGLCYGFLEPELDISGRFEDNYALGGGFSAGLLKNLTPDWKIHLTARHIWFGPGDNHQAAQAGLYQNFRISPDQAIQMDCTWEKRYDNAETGALLKYSLYF